MKNRRFALLVLALVACVKTVRADDESAVQALRDLGATIKRDESKPNKPVVAVHFCDPSMADKEWLKDLKYLPWYMLGRVDAKDDALENVKELGSLQVLDVWHTQVSDEGLKYLKDLKCLEVLDLRQTHVTDAGLEELKPLKSLRKLYLTDCAVTDRGH
jgi:Leucine Rich repeat